MCEIKRFYFRCKLLQDLGVLLDSEMTMQRHISKVTSYYHKVTITFEGCVRSGICQTVMAQLVMSHVWSWQVYRLHPLPTPFISTPSTLPLPSPFPNYTAGNLEIPSELL